MRRALLSLLAEQTNQTLWRQHFITSATPPPFHHEPTLRNRDTYYFIAITAYQMDFSRVTPSEIVFKQELASSESSVIFLVEVRNQVCVMKWYVVSTPTRLGKYLYILIILLIASQ